MPNHCVNFLAITSEDKQLDVVIKAISGEKEIDFRRIIPYPEEFEKLDIAAENWEKEHPSDWVNKPKNGYNLGGYEWCIENWGTKWNAYNVELIEKDDYRIIIKFETAWSPPHPVIKKMAELFPDFEYSHEYFERGAAFCGSAAYINGALAYEATSEYYGFRGG